MADTSFKLSPSRRERLVTMHARGDDGSLKPIEFEIPQEPEFFMGGGGLYSTGLDYLKFVRMFLNHGSLDGKTVLRPETVAMMGQNQIGNVNVVVLKTVTRPVPEFEQVVLHLPPGQGIESSKGLVHQQYLCKGVDGGCSAASSCLT